MNILPVKNHLVFVFNKCRTVPIGIISKLCAHLTIGFIALSSNLVFANEAQPRCENIAAILESKEGLVEFQVQADGHWQMAEIGDPFCHGESVRVSEFRAVIRLENDTLVRLNENSVVRFIAPKDSFWVELVRGAAHFISRTPKSFNVKAPYVNAAVEGTEFVVSHSVDSDKVHVFEGQVNIYNEQGQSRLSDLQSSTTEKSKAPSAGINIQFHDTAMWTISYPALMLSVHQQETLNKNIFAGNFSEALRQLEQAPLSVDNLITKASIHLYRGQIEFAKHALQSAAKLQPNSDQVYALEAIVSLGQLDIAAAENWLAQVKANPSQSTQVLLAESYLLQAQGEIDAARKTIKKALKNDPDHPVINIRFAELALMSGHYGAASKSLHNFPAGHFLTDRAQALKALIALQAHQNKQAAQLVIQTNALGNSDAYLNFIAGLTQIRLNNELDGRRKIELAVCLDPSNSLYRSYLGKVYSQENRNDEAIAQFVLAQQLDPNDPTSYSYEGQHYQSQFQFIKALKAYDRALEKNQARSVYRSANLLSTDFASRSNNNGAVYNKLGFNALAHNIASKSLESNPTNSQSHRLLATLYTQEPYRNTARSMERANSVLTNPLGTIPLPAGLAESGLQYIQGAGPTDIGAYEYNSAFIKEGLSLESYNTVGPRNTRASNTTASAYGDGVQFGINHYYYTSNGNRENNDTKYQITSFFTQWKITHSLTSQVELTHLRSDSGDLIIRFSPDTFSKSRRNSSDDKLQRLSIKHQSGNHSILATTAKKKLSGSETYSNLDISSELDSEGQSSQNALVWIYKSEIFNSTLGVSKSRYNTDTLDTDLDNTINSERNDVEEHYIYNHIPLANNTIDLTIGAEHYRSKWENVDDSSIINTPQINRWFPKLGARWTPIEYLTLRGAKGKSFNYFNSDLNYTFRPAKIAGFDQAFDGQNNDQSDFSGVALDFENPKLLSTGISYEKRDISTIIFLRNFSFFGTVTLNPEIKSEKMISYYSQTLTDQFAISFQLEAESIKRDQLIYIETPIGPFPLTDPNLPIKLSNDSANLTISYQPTKNFNVFIDSKVVKQHFINNQFSELSQTSESYTIIDLSLDYKINRNMMTLGLKIKNLFDRKFYEHGPELFINESRPSQLTNTPQRSFFGSLSISF